MTKMLTDQTFKLSLLWAEENAPRFHIEPDAFADLNLSEFIALFDEAKREQYQGFLEEMPIGHKTILYRQAIAKDFTTYPDLLKVFSDVLKKSRYMTGLVKFAYEREASVYNLLKRVEESEHVMHLVEYLYLSLNGQAITSEGLIRFKAMLGELMDHEVYDAFKSDMASIKALDGKVRSLTIGMNFDKNLMPESAIVISLDDKPFRYTRFMKQTSRIIESGFNALRQIPRRIFAPETVIPTDELNDMEHLIEPALKQLIQFCDLFNTRILTFIESVLEESTFYEMVVDFHSQLKSANLPTVLPGFNASISIKGFCNINLLSLMMRLSQTNQMVYNDFQVASDENCFILTGANQGGKTTITQALGHVYLLSQLGFYIPAKQVQLKIIDGLYLLFPSEEVNNEDYGRLGEECSRFSDLFEKLTPNSLFLMNETFSGTSHLESLVLATESIQALARTGATVVYNTHLHELVGQLHALNDDYAYISLVCGSDVDHHSFVMERRPPLGKSYAGEIAKKHGLSFEQLTQSIQGV